jgi:hypothetical protein
MAVSAYEVISTQTLGSAVASVTFSSIPQTHTDLVLISSPIATTDGMSLYVRFNGDTGSNYSRTLMSGYGTSAGSTRHSNVTYIGSNWQVGGGTGGTSPYIHNIQNYSNSTTYKTVIFRANNYPYSGLSEVTAEVGLWRNTAAITSINVSYVNNFAIGSTFTLYGIKAA